MRDGIVCLFDPVNMIDPLGLRLLGGGFGVSFGVGFVIDITIGGFADSDGNIGGFIDVDLSIGPQIAFDAGPTVYTNAGTVDDFAGTSLEVQGRFIFTEIGYATSNPNSTNEKDGSVTTAADTIGPGIDIGIGIGPSITKAWTFLNWKNYFCDK